MAELLRVLIVIGMAGGVAFGIDSMHAALTGGVGLMESDGALVPLGLMLPGFLFPLTTAAVGFVLARKGVVAGWSGLAIAVGALLFPASRVPGIAALAVFADVILLVGLASAGLMLLKGPAASRQQRPAGAFSPG